AVEIAVAPAVIPSREDGEGPHLQSVRHTSYLVYSISLCEVLRSAQDDKVAFTPSACKLRVRFQRFGAKRCNDITFVTNRAFIHACRQRSSPRNGDKIQRQPCHCARSASSHAREFARVRPGDHSLHQ